MDDAHTELWLDDTSGSASAPPPVAAAVAPTIVDLGTSVITVRLPRDLHAALKDEAHDHRTSLNRLCVAKLRHLL